MGSIVMYFYLCEWEKCSPLSYYLVDVGLMAEPHKTLMYSIFLITLSQIFTIGNNWNICVKYNSLDMLKIW